MTETSPKEPGATVRRLRIKQGIRRAEMARAIRCHPKSLANIESGKRNPSEVMLQRIAQFLGADVSEFPPAEPGAEDEQNGRAA